MVDEIRAEDGSPKDENGKGGAKDTRINVEISGGTSTANPEEVVKPDQAAEPAAAPAEASEVPMVEAEKFLRLAAEFDNYKKRVGREYGEIIKTANARLLKNLIELKDNFERALQGSNAGGEPEAYRRGVELIHAQLAAVLEKEGVTAIEAVGQPFNPAFHEAMMQQPSPDFDRGVVCLELQKGYRLQDRVLRHARVAVSSGKSAEAEKESRQ